MFIKEKRSHHLDIWAVNVKQQQNKTKNNKKQSTKILNWNIQRGNVFRRRVFVMWLLPINKAEEIYMTNANLKTNSTALKLWERRTSVNPNERESSQEESKRNGTNRYGDRLSKRWKDVHGREGKQSLVKW